MHERHRITGLLAVVLAFGAVSCKQEYREPAKPSASESTDKAEPAATPAETAKPAASADKGPTTQPAVEPDDAPPPSGKGVSRSGDRVSGARPRQAGSAFSSRLPVSLANYTGREIEVHAPTKALESGHLFAPIDQQDQEETKPSIDRFQVPEGVDLLQLNVDYLQPKSTYGRALGFAVKTIRNYLITDDLGNKYEMIGQYVIADVDGQQTIEIQYFPEQIGSIGRGVQQFEKVKERHLKQKDTQLYYLFLIKKGRTVMEFSTGRNSIDLRGENLVAP